MNYYNYPFFNYPYLSYPRTSLFSSLFKNKINWSSIFKNTQQTLTLINQTIPIVKQVPPIFRNAKTMFKVMNEFKKVDETKTVPTVTKSNIKLKEEKKASSYGQNNPTFFL